jgi:hypothetical protein
MHMSRSEFRFSTMGHRHELIRQSPDVMEITSRRLSNLLGRQPVLLPLVRLRLPLDLFLPLLISSPRRTLDGTRRNV